jgi:phosphoribosyl 1,2-cyclic phosphate phosphodiesterase
MKMRFLFLGTGGSTGIPVIGCHCPVCSSPLSFNKRLRPSALIRTESKSFLIDVGPDFREQALKYGIERLDGLLLTHTHYDHIAGIDELRTYNFSQKSALPCLLSQATYDELKRRYYYLFTERSGNSSLCASLDIHLLKSTSGSVEFGGVPWRYVTYEQGSMLVTGFCIGKLAYISDIKRYTDELLVQLKGTEILVLSAVKSGHSEMHFTIQEATAFAKKVGAKQTWITHIGHDLEHEEINQSLPSGIALGFDGQEFEI